MKKEISTGILIKKIHDNLEKKINKSLKDSDLTMSQMEALIILSEHTDGQMSLKALEHELHVAQSTAAGIVSRLEQKGFIEAYGQSDDKRIKNIRITENGMKYCESAAKDMDKVERELLKNLTEDEKNTLNQLLGKIYEY